MLTLLIEALPNLVERTDLSEFYTDAGFGSPEADVILQEQGVALVQSRLRGKQPDPERFNLADFDFQHDQDGYPIEITCPFRANRPGRAGAQEWLPGPLLPAGLSSLPFPSEGALPGDTPQTHAPVPTQLQP